MSGHPCFLPCKMSSQRWQGSSNLGFLNSEKLFRPDGLKTKKIKLKYQKIIADFFDNQRKSFKEALKLDDPTLTRPAMELPWLLNEMGDMERLKEVLTDLSIFCRLFLEQEYELVELWRGTGLSGDDIADLYLKAINVKGREIGSQVKDNANLKHVIYMTLIPYLGALSYFLEMGHYQSAQERVLDAQLSMMEDALAKSTDDLKKRNLSMIKLKLAYLYAETGRYTQAEAMHQEVLAIRDDLLKNAKNKTEKDAALSGLGQSYHGFAMLHSKMGNTEKSIVFYTKSMESQQELGNSAEVADSLHNMGVMLMKLDKYDKALEMCTKSLKIYEDLYYTNLPPVIGVMLGNIAVCHRNLGQVEEAEKMYRKAIDISERALGRCHPNVALALMNLGTLEVNRGNLGEAEKCLRESKDIMDKTQAAFQGGDYNRCLEKLTYILVKNNKGKEAATMFKNLYTSAVKKNTLDTAWPNVYVAMIDWLIKEKDLTFALEVTTSLLNSKVAHEKNYLQYSAICKALNKKPDPKFDKVFEGKPQSLDVLKSVIEEKLIPAENLEEIKKMLDEADADFKIGANLYGSVVMWCQNAKKEDLALGVLEHAVEKYPDEVPLVGLLAQKHYEKQKWSRVKELAERLVKMEPDNANNHIMLGDSCIRSEDFFRAKQVFIVINRKFASNDQVVAQSKGALDMIKKIEDGVLRKK